MTNKVALEIGDKVKYVGKEKFVKGKKGIVKDIYFSTVFNKFKNL